MAFVWLRQTLSLLRALGLVLGFVGVAFLASDRQLQSWDDHAACGPWACLVATLCYGISRPMPRAATWLPCRRADGDGLPAPDRREPDAAAAGGVAMAVARSGGLGQCS